MAQDAHRAVEAGAGALHFHPRGSDGLETLDAEAVGAAIEAVRVSCPGVRLGVSTGAWIEPDPRRRRELVDAWGSLPEQSRPDFAGVNFSEKGAVETCAALLEADVGPEAGLWSVEDANLLVESELADRCERLLIEPVSEHTMDEARMITQGIEEVLYKASIKKPRLLHGAGTLAWPLLGYALERGYDTRIGLEDTLSMPDGSPARDNAQLVGAATELAVRAVRAGRITFLQS